MGKKVIKNIKRRIPCYCIFKIENNIRDTNSDGKVIRKKKKNAIKINKESIFVRNIGE